jgi:hypothetical protein
MSKREITRADILPMDVYGRERAARRKSTVEVKRRRRLSVGPYATFLFENYETMWMQVHEMLYIEKGGEAQIADELHAYNPLIPQGNELVATVLFEIDDEARRRTILARLGGIEHTLWIEVGPHKVMGVPADDAERTNEAGKASSVQFVHFRFTDEQAAAFRTPGTRVLAGFDHENYQHMTVLPEATRAELAQDFA